MSKECVFYYAKVVEGNNWSKTGNLIPEPLRVECKEPIGKKPDWCCDWMKLQFDRAWSPLFTITYQGDTSDGVPCVQLRGCLGDQTSSVNFCPFCGANIVWKHNLDVKVEETTVHPQPRVANCFVVVN
ncbi:MAG: hypothetical protein ABIH46_14140 [Chloroflexota bacterium]